MKTIVEAYGNKPSRPVKVIQFGEGNFLRAFVDWMIQKTNDETDFNGGIAVVQPLANGLCNMLEDQNCLYTHYMNGLKNGEAASDRVINDCINYTVNPYDDYAKFMSLAEIETAKFIISNTTEAGIAYDENDKLDMTPQNTFPGKLTALLYKRYQLGLSGFVLLPCELIDYNGDILKEVILKYVSDWQLEDGFKTWIEEENTFCNTLVDRIVPGYPRETIEQITTDQGYKDNLVVESEQFNLWVIEGPSWIQDIFPVNETECNVIFTDDVKPYKMRKVRILNGAHTTMVPIGYLYGMDTVREVVEDATMGALMEKAIYEEIIPTLTLSKEELELFAKDVMDRFKNPYVKHYLMSISLNSMPKYRTRVLPSLLGYIEKEGSLPKVLSLALAAYIVFYKGERNGQAIDLKDNEDILELFDKLWSSYTGNIKEIDAIVAEVLAYETLWEADLNTIPHLADLVSDYVKGILNKGMEAIVKEVL